MKTRRFLAWLLSLAMLTALLPAGALFAAADDTTVVVGEHPELLTTYGRTYVKEDTLYLFWTNSGVAFRFNGTGATATLTGDDIDPMRMGVIAVYVDGEFSPSRTLELRKASDTYVLAEGLPEGEHTIELRKRNEAEALATVGVKDITVTGAFTTPPARPATRVEVVGDSITCGFGNMVTDGSGHLSSPTQDGTMTYAVLAAKELGADVSIVARSGIGFCRNVPGLECFYDYYAKTAALRDKTGSDEDWDFAANQNDVVVINLGTNDNGAKPDGKTPITDAAMTDEAVAFLELVREKNPNAVIIWTYGLMGNGRQKALSAAVDKLAAKGDDKVFYMPIENYISATEGTGSSGHPTIQTDINRSVVLAQFIADKTGWKMNARPMLQAQLQQSAIQYNDEVLAGYTEMSARKFKSAMTAGATLAAKTDATNEEYMAAANAIWQASLALMKPDDVSKEYIVVDTCDAKNGNSQLVPGGEVDLDDFIEGEGCLSVTGAAGAGLLCINRINNAYNITLPEDWQNWYLEMWVYVSDADKMPTGVLEVSEVVDQKEMQWFTSAMGLKTGWNKVQLKMNSSGTKDGVMEKLQNIRFFWTNLTADFTFKLDNIVLAKGKAAENTEALSAALTEAETLLAEKEDAALRAAYDRALNAVSQADVDLFTARLTAAIEAAKKPAALDTISAAENPEWITTYGRTYVKSKALWLFWTNSGISFRFNGTGATANILADNIDEKQCGHLNVYVDGEFSPSRTIVLTKTNQKDVVLAEGLPEGEHTIELRKRNEAIYGGSSNIALRTITVTGGSFLEPPAKPSRTIEFIGDSITSGFGNMVSDGSGENTFSTTVEGTMTYAVLAAKELGANASVLSRSGMGFIKNATCDSFVDYYEKTASLPGNPKDTGDWDFAANPSDVVVINLGTNDNGAKVNGKVLTDVEMTNEAVDFLKLVRKNNPNAVIIWTYGIMGNGRQKALSAAVELVRMEGDDKVFYCPLANFVAATEGTATHGHPTIQTSINRSVVLAQFIADKTGWEMDASVMVKAQLQYSSPYNNDEYLAKYNNTTTTAFKAALAAGEEIVKNASATNEQCVAAANDIWKSFRALSTAPDPDPDPDKDPDKDPTILWGDANRDEDVTTADARLILQYAAELKDESEIDMVAADVVSDGEVTTADARAILQFCAEIIDTLPVKQ